MSPIRWHLQHIPCRRYHYSDAIMSAMVSQITGISVVYSSVCSDADQRKCQRSASLAFVRGIRRSPEDSPHKGSVTRKMFPFDDVIMITRNFKNFRWILPFCMKSICYKSKVFIGLFLHNNLMHWSCLNQNIFAFLEYWPKDHINFAENHKQVKCWSCLYANRFLWYLNEAESTYLERVIGAVEWEHRTPYKQRRQSEKWKC